MVQKDNDPPLIPEELLEYIEENIPPRDWHFTDDKDEIIFYSGKRELVILIRQWFEKQRS